MKQFWTKLSKPEDAEEIGAWLARIAEKNLVDGEVFDYPATSILSVTNGERNLLHVPIQRVYMVESLAISPVNSSLDTARALYSLFQVVRWESQKAGHGEVYFLCRDEETIKFAEHNGMERVNVPLFRMKVNK